MTESASSAVVLPIDAIKRIYPELQKAVPRFWNQTVQAQCIACGIRLQAQELQKLAEDSNLSPKLERLRMGYCARNTCESRFYSIALPAEASEIGVLSFLANTLPELPAKKPLIYIAPKQVVTIAALFTLLCIVLFSIHHAYYGGRIPLLQERHEYKTDGTAHRQDLLEQ